MPKDGGRLYAGHLKNFIKHINGPKEILTRWASAAREGLSFS